MEAELSAREAVRREFYGAWLRGNYSYGTSKLSSGPLPLSDLPRPIPGQLTLFPQYTGK